MKKPHECKPMAPTCCCHQLADEPSWDCPIHGGAIINRCDCGRFVRVRSWYPCATCGAEHDVDGCPFVSEVNE